MVLLSVWVGEVNRIVSTDGDGMDGDEGGRWFLIGSRLSVAKVSGIREYRCGGTRLVRVAVRK